MKDSTWFGLLGLLCVCLTVPFPYEPAQPTTTIRTGEPGEILTVKNEELVWTKADACRSGGSAGSYTTACGTSGGGGRIVRIEE